jgi:hypothetical protein
MDDLGEMIQIDGESLRADIEAQGYSMRQVLDEARGIYLEADYLSHRIRKGSIPEKVLKAVCDVIAIPHTEYIIKYDLSDVSSWQMREELKKRGRL